MTMKVLASIAAASVILVASATGAAAGSRYATAEMTFAVGGDGFCHPVSTATWSGYAVHHVQHFYYRDGAYTNWGAYTEITSGSTAKSGTLVGTSAVRAGPGEVWTVHLIFRTKGGGRVVEADSNPVVVPSDCPVP